MVDKAMTVRRERIGPIIGRIDDDVMLAVERSLALWFGLAR
jgi:mRNA interferase MazF